MPKRKKVLTTVFSEKRAKARRHTGPARPVAYVKAGTGFAKRKSTKFLRAWNPKPTRGLRRQAAVRGQAGVQLWTPGQISRSAICHRTPIESLPNPIDKW